MFRKSEPKPGKEPDMLDAMIRIHKQQTNSESLAEKIKYALGIRHSYSEEERARMEKEMGIRY